MRNLIIAAVGEDGGGGGLWDGVLNLGERQTKGLRNLSMSLDARRVNHVILRHGEELGLLGMIQDGVMQNLKLSDLKFVYVFYKLYGVF